MARKLDTEIEKEKVTEKSMSKNDENKVRPLLVEGDFILGMAKVLEFGAIKYGVNNWKAGSSLADIDRVKNAILRHTIALIYQDEMLDLDSGLPHSHHIAVNLMFLTHHKNKGK